MSLFIILFLACFQLSFVAIQGDIYYTISDYPYLNISELYCTIIYENETETNCISELYIVIGTDVECAFDGIEDDCYFKGGITEANGGLLNAYIKNNLMGAEWINFKIISPVNFTNKAKFTVSGSDYHFDPGLEYSVKSLETFETLEYIAPAPRGYSTYFTIDVRVSGNFDEISIENLFIELERNGRLENHTIKDNEILISDIEYGNLPSDILRDNGKTFTADTDLLKFQIVSAVDLLQVTSMRLYINHTSATHRDFDVTLSVFFNENEIIGQQVKDFQLDVPFDTTFVFDIVITESPTKSPTPPTESPTESPTKSPTPPTESPTKSPTPPTESPTLNPTKSPVTPSKMSSEHSNNNTNIIIASASVAGGLVLIMFIIFLAF